MSAITENKFYKALEDVITKSFDPKFKQMTQFKDALVASELAKLFFQTQGEESKVSEQKQRGRKKKSADAKADKPKRTANAYMLFLKDKRKEIEQRLLEETPELKGKDLQTAITKKAGEIWKLASDEDKKPYTDQANELKKKAASASVLEDEEEKADEEDIQDDAAVDELENTQDDDGPQLKFSEKYEVWYDVENSVCYKTSDITTPPVGLMRDDIFVPFKKTASAVNK